MTILKPDFSQIIHTIEQMQQGKKVDWYKIISNNMDEVQDGYKEIIDKIAEVNDRVIQAKVEGACMRCIWSGITSPTWMVRGYLETAFLNRSTSMPSSSGLRLLVQVTKW